MSGTSSLVIVLRSDLFNASAVMDKYKIQHTPDQTLVITVWEGLWVGGAGGNKHVLFHPVPSAHGTHL